MTNLKQEEIPDKKSETPLKEQLKNHVQFHEERFMKKEAFKEKERKRKSMSSKLESNKL